MKILHYTIGFAPERTGGLVGYATDLMIEQKKQNHEVFALYPSNQFFFGNVPKIRNKKERAGIKTFGLINSLPLALFGGISNPNDFMIGCNKEIFIKFLRELTPDVIHLHSLIGLYKEFLQAANDLNIKVVFTTHDYYGLAPIPNFYYNGVSFDKNNTNLTWNIMSADALPTSKLRVFQLSLYPTIRRWMKKVNKNPKHAEYKEISTVTESINYSLLMQYYSDMFQMIDKFHFNSTLSQEIYKYNLPFKIEGRVISITNGTIKHHYVKRSLRKKKIVAYIGPDEEYKGYFDFLKFINTLDLSKYQIETYGHTPNSFAPEFVVQKGRFDNSDLEKVYTSIDYLIIPSRWKETFGLITLEALSFGVEVYASENVGSKDLLDSSHIFRDIEEVKFETVSTLETVTKQIEEHVKEIDSLYCL
ncbi:Glycosyl transferases group 1 [Streptococcus henryi]|uniref:Glycosyl transferases group 1 n=1 Tax=Streptococcus henryi TaxID=439219 RepID=A0A1G6DA26_9STRE|nr:glycosyltransferase [Streptococcus henryi]SDB41919.1 Glycosyl transferases group 1 [Streptococcus henryi]